MNHFDILVGAIACKVSHNLSSCNPPRQELENVFCITFDDFVGWAEHETVFLCSFQFRF